MANPLAAVKRAPKWAWFTAIGVGVGAASLRMWKDRAKPATGQDATTIGDTTAPVSNQPSPVIIPPVINTTPGGDGGSLTDLAQVFTTGIGGAFDTLGGLLGTSIEGTQGNLGTALGIIGDQSSGILSVAQAGSAPAPIQVNPTPIIVKVPPAKGNPTPAPPVRLWEGHPLSWWKNPTNARRHGKWRWPGESGFHHSRHFNGG